MSIIDKCVKCLEEQNHPNSQFGRRMVNRSSVVLLPRAWSDADRCLIRANAGHWEGNRFISDTTSLIGVWMYAAQRITLDPKARTVQLMSKYEWWGSTEARILHETRLGVVCQYILATHVDPGAWAVRCVNGWFQISPLAPLYDTRDGLVCHADQLRIMRTDVTPESTKYVRAVGRHIRDRFRNIDMFRRSSDPEHGPYSATSMAPYFEMGIAEKTRMMLEWWRGGGEMDDDVYRCMLSISTYGWHYKYNAFTGRDPVHAERFFNNHVLRAANMIRRAKYSTPY